MECASRMSLIWFCREPCGGKRLALAAFCDTRSSRVRRICYALRVANFLLYLRRNPRLARVASSEGCAMGDRHCAAGSVTVAAPYSAAYVSLPPHHAQPAQELANDEWLHAALWARPASAKGD